MTALTRVEFVPKQRTILTREVTTMQQNPILVVDDDEAIGAFVKEALEDEGYEVLIAENGQIALDIVNEQPVSFILLDMRMPVMDGWEFLSAYQDTAAPHAPVVAMSAHVRSIETSTSDVAAFLPKPFDLYNLLELIQQYRKPASANVL
jgi:CheY-like chemotaxis protein